MKLTNGRIRGFLISYVLLLIVGFFFYPFESLFYNRSASIVETKAFQDSPRGIACDSEKKLYIGFRTGIYVYSADGEFLYRYVMMQNTGYSFCIKNGILTVLYWHPNKREDYTLDGRFLSEGTFADDEFPFTEFQSVSKIRKCSLNGKQIYRYRSILTFWWVTNESNDIVATSPFIIVLIKVFLPIAFFAVFVLVLRSDQKLFPENDIKKMLGYKIFRHFLETGDS